MFPLLTTDMQNTICNLICKNVARLWGMIFWSHGRVEIYKGIYEIILIVEPTESVIVN